MVCAPWVPRVLLSSRLACPPSKALTSHQLHTCATAARERLSSLRSRSARQVSGTTCPVLSSVFRIAGPSLKAGGILCSDCRGQQWCKDAGTGRWGVRGTATQL